MVFFYANKKKEVSGRSEPAQNLPLSFPRPRDPFPDPPRPFPPFPRLPLPPVAPVSTATSSLGLLASGRSDPEAFLFLLSNQEWANSFIPSASLA